MNSVTRLNAESKMLRLHTRIREFAISGSVSVSWGATYVHPRLKRGRVFPKTISLHEIAMIALESHPSVSLDDVKSPSRRQHIIAARRHVARLIKEMRPDASSPDIGAFLNRDHTSILWLLGRLTRKGKVAC